MRVIKELSSLIVPTISIYAENKAVMMFVLLGSVTLFLHLGKKIIVHQHHSTQIYNNAVIYLQGFILSGR